MLYCPNCSAQVNSNERFCNNCGMALPWAAQQTPPPPPPQPQQPPYSQQIPYSQPPPDQPYPPAYQQPGWNPSQQYYQPTPYNQPPTYNQPPGWDNTGQYWQQNIYASPVAMPGKSRSRILLISILAIAIVLIAGGIILATRGNSVTTPSANIPTVTSFTADPSAITTGQVTTLSWDISGATSVNIDQGIGEVAAKGSKILTLIETTTYTLTASNSAGSETAATTITVSKVAVPEISRFAAEPSTINSNQSATLQWIVSGTTSVTITPGVGETSPNGLTTVSPSTTTTYTLTATNESGSSTATTTVTLAGGGKPVIKLFEADPPTVGIGQTVILRWSVEAANTVLLDHGYGPVGTSGLETFSLEATDTFVLTAINSYGETTASVTIEVK